MDTSDITREDVIEFTNDLNIYSKNKPITAADYQITAIHKALHDKRITLISPTSSGKSLVIYCCIRWILEQSPDNRVLLIVPSITLVNQMYGDFLDYSSHNEWNVHENCQKLFSGQSKELSKRILITTWQSFSKISKDRVNGPKILSLYNGVIVDECHMAKSVEMQSILEKCIHSEYRIGTTGTIDTKGDAKVNVLQIEGYLGPVYKVISTRELMDAKKVSDLEIKCLVLKYSKEECELIKSADYQQEIQWLVENDQRNNFIMKLALSIQGAALLLFRHRESHAKKLYDILRKNTIRPVYYISGTVDSNEREKIRLLANKDFISIDFDKFTFFVHMGVQIPLVDGTMLLVDHVTEDHDIDVIQLMKLIKEGKIIGQIVVKDQDETQ
jgi:superfamily II DNA or RNA helicase